MLEQYWLASIEYKKNVPPMENESKEDYELRMKQNLMFGMTLYQAQDLAQGDKGNNYYSNNPVIKDVIAESAKRVMRQELREQIW